MEEQALLPGHRAVEKALVLGGVELPVGLQIGRLHKLRGRAVACRLENFVVCNSDASPPVLLAEQGVRHELVEGLVHQSLSLVERDTLIAALSRLLLEILRCLVPSGGENILSVDGGGRCGARHRRSSEQTRSLREKKASDEQYDDDYPDVFCGGPHCLQQGHYSLHEFDGPAVLAAGAGRNGV